MKNEDGAVIMFILNFEVVMDRALLTSSAKNTNHWVSPAAWLPTGRRRPLAVGEAWGRTHKTYPASGAAGLRQNGGTDFPAESHRWVLLTQLQGRCS